MYVLTQGTTVEVYCRMIYKYLAVKMSDLTYRVLLKTLDLLSVACGRRLIFVRTEDQLEMPVLCMVGRDHNGLLVHKAQASRSDHHRTVESLEFDFIEVAATSVLDFDNDLLHPTGSGRL